jgi:hypothetical protein
MRTPSAILKQWVREQVEIVICGQGDDEAGAIETKTAN